MQKLGYKLWYRCTHIYILIIENGRKRFTPGTCVYICCIRILDVPLKNWKKKCKKKKEKKRNRISRCVFPHFRLNILNLKKKQFSIFRFNINFKYKVSCFTSFIIIHHIASLLLPTRAYLDHWKTNRVTDRRTSILFVWFDYCNLVIMIYMCT